MGKPDAPQPVNPFLAASAQTGSNVATSVANAYLGNVNQQTPTGSLTYAPTGSYQWGDPTTGQTYNIPTFTATQTLSPMQQQIQNLNDLGREQLAATGYEQSAKLRGLLGSGINVAGAPAGGNAAALAGAPQAQTTFGDAGNISTGFGQAGNISQQIANAGQIGQQFGQVGNVANTYGATGTAPTTYAAAGTSPTTFGATGTAPTTFGAAGPLTKTYGDFASERNRVEQGLMDRLNPSLGQERQKYEQQLADQGIRAGSPAYENAMRNYSIQANDARLGAIAQAGGEQQRMADMAAQRAGFQNAAQQQEYAQALGRGQFAQQGIEQQYQQALGRGQFAQQGQAQQAQQALARGQFAQQGQSLQSQQALERGQFANQAQRQAYEQALGRGQFANQAQQQQFTQNAAQSDFYNKAQQQLFEQLYGREQFANAAQQQLFGQQAARGSFANTGLAQNFQQQQAAFNASQAARSQYWNEQFALRNQPLNEITALMSGSQVQQPNFVGANMPTIPTTDIAGLMNSNFNQQMDVFKQNSANTNALIGGVLGAGSSLGSAFIRSDRDVKENIERMGTVFADNGKRLPIYQYSYKDDPSEQRHVGPMAQDVEKIDKRAVRKFDGVRHIDLPKLGSILKAA